MPDTAVISVSGLRKTYREGLILPKKYDALRGISLEVSPGEVFGLLGPNGAGKTTLIKILLGIIRRTGGEANLLGRPAGSREARMRVGYLPENLTFPKHHTGIAALKFLARLSWMDEKTINRRCDELLELVGLKGRETEPVRKYSKGMRQRLGLAQALMHDPDLLILDEPTDGLDPLGRSQVRQVLIELKKQGKTIFLNSHILQEVELVCDRVAIMAGGSIRGLGSVGDLTSQFASKAAIRLFMEIAAVKARVEELFQGHKIRNVYSLSTDLTVIELLIDENSEIDAHVDRVRGTGLSLLRLERQRPNLEQVFLQVVESHALPNSERS